MIFPICEEDKEVKWTTLARLLFECTYDSMNYPGKQHPHLYVNAPLDQLQLHTTGN